MKRHIFNPDCPLVKNSVIPAQAGIQLIEYYPAKRDNMAVLHSQGVRCWVPALRATLPLYPQGVGYGCLAEVLAPFGGKGLKLQQHTLSATRNVLLLDSRLRGNDGANGLFGFMPLYRQTERQAHALSA